MNRNSKVAVFTSIRSEYGLLLPLLRYIKSESYFDLRLMAGGAHLLPEYGHTIDQIRKDEFTVDVEMPFLEPSSSQQPHTAAMAKLLEQAGSYFAAARPDLLVVLGDRFELLSVVSAALVMSIPILHISGGDVTEGAIDNQVRHAITKMANIHFPATQIYKQNLMRMGEEEWRICVTGEPGLDEVLQMEFLDRESLFQELELSEELPVILCTFHPETIENEITPAFVREVIAGISAMGSYQLLLTAANFDQGGPEINDVLAEAAATLPRVQFIKSLGQKRYYSLLKYTALVIGNSSSGLTEVQSFQIPALNVGKRQAGRLANPNVLHVKAHAEDILAAIKYVQEPEFRAEYEGKPNIYGDGHAAERMHRYLVEVDAAKLLLKKSVY